MKVKIIKLWPVAVLLFSTYCLYTLISDSYEVLYLERNKTAPLQFLVCNELSQVYPKRTEIDLKELKNDLYGHLNSSEIYRDKREDYREAFELILNRIKTDGYLIHNQKLCLISKDQKELRILRIFLPFRCVFFAMNSDTFDFVRMGLPDDQINQLIVRKKEHPSDCDQSNRRFLCLNDCFRRRFRLSRYFYHANETGRIFLDYSNKNRTIQESERICFRQCNRENCKLAQLIVLGFFEKAKEPKIFEAESILSAFDFWVEIIGLIFSFVGLFFDQFASTVTKLTEKLTRSRVRRRKVRVGLFCLNLTIILLGLAYCGYLCVRVALEWQTDTKDLPEREMARNLIQQKIVHLAICVSIGKVKEFKNNTMWEIEKITDRMLGDVLKGIYVSDAGRSFRTDYQVHSKILFGYGRRCFPLSIHPNYQTIPSRPILTVTFKRYDYYYPQLHVLSEEENLNSKSFEYQSYAFQKRVVKRLKGRCLDYKVKYENCSGRQICVERCIARKFIERYNRTTFGIAGHGLVFDRDWFSPSEWNTSQLMNPYVDWSLYPNVSGECEEKFQAKACNEIKFERTVQIKQPGDLTLEIDLKFDVVRSAEELPYSLRMALDLLGIQSIFFGFTLLQLFWMVYQFTKPRWRWRLKDKTDKVVWFIVCLFFSLGCSWTTVRMLDGIVNGELVPIEHYELAERVQMPTIMFCFRIDQKLIDRNYQLTGNYLEEFTEKINARSTFWKIAYLNESNEWTRFDLRWVERFFLLNMKCFRVHINQTYDRDQFHFLDDTEVLKVNFKRTQRNEHVRLVHFMTKSKETEEFSKTLNLNYSMGSRYEVIHESFLYEYEDHFGLFRRHFPPLPEGDVGDLRRQLLELQGNEPHRKTLSLPVEEEHFGLEVDEDRFEQLHLVQKKKSLNKRTNLNYRQMFFANHLRFSDFQWDFRFQLVFLRRVMHFTNEVNYATLTLALLNLLSLWLELGVLDLRPFLVRLHDHLLVPIYLYLPVLLLRRLIKVLLFCCRCLRKFEPYLYERIDCQQKEEEEEDSPDDSFPSDQHSVTSVSSIT